MLWCWGMSKRFHLWRHKNYFGTTKWSMRIYIWIIISGLRMDDLVPSSPAAFAVSRTIIFFNCSWQGGLLSTTSSLFRFPYLSEHFIRTWVCSRKIMPLISCKTTFQRWICNIGLDISSKDEIGQHGRESAHGMAYDYVVRTIWALYYRPLDFYQGLFRNHYYDSGLWSCFESYDISSKSRLSNV